MLTLILSKFLVGSNSNNHHSKDQLNSYQTSQSFMRMYEKYTSHCII